MRAGAGGRARWGRIPDSRSKRLPTCRRARGARAAAPLKYNLICEPGWEAADALLSPPYCPPNLHPNTRVVGGVGGWYDSVRSARSLFANTRVLKAHKEWIRWFWSSCFERTSPGLFAMGWFVVLTPEFNLEGRRIGESTEWIPPPPGLESSE